MSTQTVRTLKLTRKEEEKLYEAWQEYEAKTPPYARFQLRPENCVITCYESGKTVFQGKDCDVYAAPFMHEAPGIPASSSAQTDILPQAGSDETGTGDYFGPVCVCAAIVAVQDMELIHELGIRDSKALSDKKIREAAPRLMEQLVYSLLILDPARYNKVHETSNMNAIKARMHNQAYVNLSKKAELPSFRIVDQFVPSYSYYRFLRNEPVIIKDIHFETKAEDHYPAVAAASVIARYAFVRSMDAMEEKYGMAFAKGGGENADECARSFVQKFGMDELANAAKIHFKNTEKL